MKNTISKLAAALAFAAILFVSILPATAQFADQATYVTASGTANAITLPVQNWSRNLPGVPLRFLPTADNTSSVTVLVNGVGSPVALLKPSNAGLVALSGGELRSGQMATVAYDGTQFVLLNQLGQSVLASALANSALSYGQIVNLQLNASVGTNALTIAVKTSAGTDPTATNPVLIPFRDNTIANGGPKIVALGGALSFTISSSNTMGCTSASMCRLWIIAICSTGLECTNSGTTDVVGLCAINVYNGTDISAIDESALWTSASGTGGGSSAQTLYCGISAVTARAIRILGYVDIQEATAGTWATGPTVTQLFGPGIKKPGDVLQSRIGTTSSTTTSTSGANVATNLTRAISLSSAANLARVQALGTGATVSIPSGNQITSQISRGSGPTLIGNVAVFFVNNSSFSSSALINFALDKPNTTSSTSYTVYFGQSGGSSTAIYLQGGGTGIIVVDEIMGALPEPVNDDGGPARMVG